MFGYSVYGQKNDSYAFRTCPRLTEYQKLHQTLIPDMSGAPRQDVLRCEACGELQNKWIAQLTNLMIKTRKYDISSTYDGITVVSPRFKSAYEAAGLNGLSFQSLPDDPEFFAIQAQRVVDFDAARRKTRFIKPCAVCGHYESVVGASPVYLMPGSRIDDREFVRTDLEFASQDEKHPLLLCGVAAGNALKSAKLKGLDLVPI